MQSLDDVTFVTAEIGVMASSQIVSDEAFLICTNSFFGYRFK